MPTRNVVLTDHQAAFVDSLVASGRYQNASEVLRACWARAGARSCRARQRPASGRRSSSVLPPGGATTSKASIPAAARAPGSRATRRIEGWANRGRVIGSAVEVKSLVVDAIA